MKRLKLVNCLLCLLLASLYSFSQLRLGEATFAYAKARVIKQPMAISQAVQSISYLEKIGGVAFDKVASPIDSLHVSNIKLSYDSLAIDGKRLALIINDKKVTTNLFDWEMIPIAKYANSSYYACFTLFGQLDERLHENQVRLDRGQILNYHQDLFNTLLGLRLFQLDILILEHGLSTDLPKLGNKYLLGKGEKIPNLDSNWSGYFRFNKALDSLYQPSRSYLICDTNASIRFSIQEDSLMISGEPFYYFFRYDIDDGHRDILVKDSLDNIIYKIRSSVKTSIQKNYSEEQWLLKNLKQEFRAAYDSTWHALYNRYITDLAVSKQWYGESYYLTELKSDLSKFIVDNGPKNIVYLDTLSVGLSAKPELFRDINPAIWHAAEQTMRFSAFFRYCKKNYPEEWSNFLHRIKGVRIEPVVRTPTIMYPDKNK